jgi:transcriptional regulator with XRE-family HTH domain
VVGQSVRGELEERLVELGKFIQDQRRRTHLSVRRLADLSGISNSYLGQIESGLRKPSADILHQLSKALSISAETLFVRAGILDATTLPPSGVIEAIRADLELSDDQKSSLVQIYESFRATGPAVSASAAPTASAAPAPKPTIARNRRPATKVV